MSPSPIFIARRGATDSVKTVASLVLGNLMPARLPASTGTTRTAGTKAAFDSALAASAAGDIVSLTANIVGPVTTGWSWNKSGTALAPITILGNGFIISNFNGLYIDGSYNVIKNLKWTNCGSFGSQDGMKINGSFVELDGCECYYNIGSGMLFGGSCVHPQVWNCRIRNNGQNLAYDHGMYCGYTGTGGFGGAANINGVIANCLVYDNYGYNMQLYSNPKGLLVTGCTVDAGMSHPQGPTPAPADDASYARGGITIGGGPAGSNDNGIIVGCLTTNAPNTAGFHIGAGATDPIPPVNLQIQDCIAFGNAGGDYDASGGTTFTNLVHANPLYVNQGARNYALQAGSPAIGLVQAARYGLLPALDINGNPRITADAGCFRA